MLLIDFLQNKGGKKMKYTKYKNLIKKTLICELNTIDLVFVFNEYCEYNNLIDSMIMTRDEFFDFIDNLEPYEAMRQGVYGDFSPVDDYFSLDGYGYLKSIYPKEYIENFLTDLACYILDNEQSFGYDELQELIDEYWYSEDDLSDYN